MVSVLAFYSDDPSLNPSETYIFSVEFVFEKPKNKQKRGRNRPINKINKLKCLVEENTRKNGEKIAAKRDHCTFPEFVSVGVTKKGNDVLAMNCKQAQA